MTHPTIAQPAWRIGVDTGGTFTDVVLVDPDGQVRATYKLLSTPEDPGRAVLEGVAAILRPIRLMLGIGEELAPTVVHGSTVATNAVLEDKGDRAALITTAGFEDLLTLARQDRPELYALSPQRPAPPIPRELTLGVAERLAYDGSVLIALTQGQVNRVVDRLAQLNVDAVAICLLHSYANPEHERALARAIADRLPGVHLTVSSTLLPEMREYERAATCAVNAIVGPMMSRYVGKLDAALGGGRLRVMGTGGGTLSPRGVNERPVETIMSGPAGGVIGAWAMARSAGEPRVIGFDMGGTSTDVSLCDGGPSRTPQSEIAGLPIKLPMIDLHTVGAGGGSVAWIDDGGALRVGPQSAGADPGPACYGRQGALETPLPTVTDAHAALGHLRDGRRLGDSLSVDRPAATAAIQHLADRLKLPLAQAAEGILRVADAAMARAVQRVSVQRGHDARRFTLIAFGGAGGLHACRLAQMLGMSRVLVPLHGGLLSAVGMLAAPPRYSFSQGVLVTVEHDGQQYNNPTTDRRISDALNRLRVQALNALKQDAIDADTNSLHYRMDLRFVGQSYEITVPLDHVTPPTEHFLVEHERLYGYAPQGKPIEIVAVRVEAAGPTPQLHFTDVPEANLTPPGDTPTAQIIERDQATRWPLLDRKRLAPGDIHDGPLILEEYAATTVVPRGWKMEVLPDGQLILTQ